MKVLFVALGIYRGVGGMEQFNQRVVRSLSELESSTNLQSRCIALWDSPEDSREAPNRTCFFSGNAGKLRTTAAFAWRVWRMRPEIIVYGHILLSPLAGLARLLSRRSNHVLIVHGREAWRAPFRRRLPVWERLAVRYLLDATISVSRFTAQRMESAYGISGRTFHILPNAVDLPAEPRPEAARQMRPSHGARLITVARMGSGNGYKGFKKVIRALPAILSSFPETHYDVVGRGPLRDELQRLATEIGVKDHVHFHGYLDERQLEEAYRNADVFVMPSVGEGFGIVFLEAWKHRLPVVAGNKDASAEVVTHGLNGLCVNPDSVEEIAAAVINLLRDKERASRMGEAGYRTVLERYRQENFCGRLREILLLP